MIRAGCNVSFMFDVYLEFFPNKVKAAPRRVEMFWLSQAVSKTHKGSE
jgi:hypothetical protein